MTINANPSVDPANEDSLAGTFKHAFNKLLQSVDGMLPARVVAFDRKKNRVQVQPLIMVLSTNRETVSRAQLASIPVLQIGGGGYMMNFNLTPGDLGWILASDRDISNFLQSYAEAQPNTLRKNDFADSLFIPNIMHNFNILDEDEEHAVLQSVDGAVRIALWPDKVKITPELLVAGDVVIQGDLTVEGATATNGGLTSTGGGANSIVINGNVRAVGNIEATGNITPHVP